MEGALERENEPYWMQCVRDLVLAVAFQRATRRVHVIGKDGRVRHGCVDLLGCYAVDDMARELCRAMKTDFPENITAPDERTAMQMLAEGKTWRDWLAQTPPGEGEGEAISEG